LPELRHVGLEVNGTIHTLDIPSGASLLHVLRNDLGLNGPKYGCGLGQCGACTVLIDGKAARSCVLPAANLEGFAIVTLEGLGSRADPHPVQRAFIKHSASQCGYCLNGMIMTLAALLTRRPGAGEAEIREALRYNLCRCGSHVEVLHAALAASAEMRTASFP
jgi:nicotinate dehydrogenase subunit A